MSQRRSATRQGYSSLAVLLGILFLPLSAGPSLAAPSAGPSVGPVFDQGMLKFSRQDFKGAIADFSRVVALDPRAVRAYGYRGNARLALGDLSGAIADYTEVIRLKPDSALAYANRAVARNNSGDPTGAMADLRKAVQLFQAIGDTQGYRAALSALKTLSNASSEPSPKRPVLSALPGRAAADLPVSISRRPLRQIVSLGLTFTNRIFTIGGSQGLVIGGWTSEAARRSGLRLGDELVALGGESVNPTTDFPRLLRRYKPGELVKLSIRRSGEPMAISLKLADSLVALPVLTLDSPPRTLSRLTPLPVNPILRAEQFLGWGNVRSTETRAGGPAFTIGPVADEIQFKQQVTRLAAQLRPLGIKAFSVEVESLLPEHAWSATVAGTGGVSMGSATPDWRTNRTVLEAGLFLPVRLDLTAERRLEGGEIVNITGKIAYDLRDRSGVPLVSAGTPVGGRVIGASPFGHRLVIESLAGQPIAAESEVLPSRERLEVRSGFFGSGIGGEHRTVLLSGQVIGARLTGSATLPTPEDKSEEAGSAPPRVVHEIVVPVRTPNPTQALALHNQAVQLAAESQYEAAGELWQASLARQASVEAREALGWAYERIAQQTLATGSPGEAVAWLELALPLRSDPVNARALLACAYGTLLAPKKPSPGTAQLNYYRHRVAVEGLQLQEYLGNQGILFAEGLPDPAQGDYFAQVTTNGVMRLSRLPIRVYLGGAPEPRFARVAWEAARTWETASNGLVRFVQVNQPTEADIEVSYTIVSGGVEAGRAEVQSLGAQMPALNINLNLRPVLEARLADQEKILQGIAIHEFGHTLGLWGHSDDLEDIMYPESSAAFVPSARDIRTLARLYATPPRITRP